MGRSSAQGNLASHVVFVRLLQRLLPSSISVLLSQWRESTRARIHVLPRKGWWQNQNSQAQKLENGWRQDALEREKCHQAVELLQQTQSSFPARVYHFPQLVILLVRRVFRRSVVIRQCELWRVQFTSHGMLQHDIKCIPRCVARFTPETRHGARV